MSIKNQELSYQAAGKTYRGQLYLPEGDNLAGVLLAPEWWGLSEHVKNCAEKLAQAGYAALAMDVYGEAFLTHDAEQANAHMTEVLKNPETLEKITQAALDALAAEPAVNAEKIAAIGFCFGGKVALDMARKGQNIKAAVSFHGNLSPAQTAKAGAIKAKLLIEHGEKDSMVSMEDLENFKQEMQAAGADYHIDVFKDAKHGFTNPQADANAAKNGVDLAYSQAAANQAWNNMLLHLKRTIS